MAARPNFDLCIFFLFDSRLWAKKCRGAFRQPHRNSDSLSDTTRTYVLGWQIVVDQERVLAIPSATEYGVMKNLQFVATLWIGLTVERGIWLWSLSKYNMHYWYTHEWIVDPQVTTFIDLNFLFFVLEPHSKKKANLKWFSEIGLSEPNFRKIGCLISDTDT